MIPTQNRVQRYRISHNHANKTPIIFLIIFKLEQKSSSIHSSVPFIMSQSSSIASLVLLLILYSRPPQAVANNIVLTTPRTLAAIHTVPTGFSTVPPPGPAIPDVATAQSAPVSTETPCTICITTCSLTAPYLSRVSLSTPSTFVLTSLWYATTPPSIIDEHPGTEVIAAATEPPVQLSAVAMDNPRFCRSDTSSTAIVPTSALPHIVTM